MASLIKPHCGLVEHNPKRDADLAYVGDGKLKFMCQECHNIAVKNGARFALRPMRY